VPSIISILKFEGEMTKQPRSAAALYASLPWDLEPGKLHYIEDPFGLREAIVPILSMEPKKGLLTGLGTAFCTDPFGGHLTAQHVLEDHIPELNHKAPKDAINVGIMSPGIVFGAPPLPNELFIPVNRAECLRGKADDPMGALAGDPPKSTNVLDLMSLGFHTDEAPERDQLFLPIRAQGKPLEIGDTVMAVGFACLKTEGPDKIANAITITGYLYGMQGKVTGLHELGLSKTRPGPVFEVDVAWPSGMSGGPVFNRDGEVIGIVSRGMDGYMDAPGMSLATWFEKLGNGPFLPFVDPRNPGWIIGWGVFETESDRIMGLFPDPDQATENAKGNPSALAVRPCAHHIGTEDYMIFNDQTM
jgi:serine protease Do